MEQEAYPKKKSNIVLEPMDQGAITVFWSEIEACVRASIDDDDASVARALMAVRSREMIPLAIWSGDKVAAILISRQMEDGYSGGKAMLIYGLHGDGLSMEGWLEAAKQFENYCRFARCRKILAYVKDDKIAKLATGLGWDTQTICWKELTHG